MDATLVVRQEYATEEPPMIPSAEKSIRSRPRLIVAHGEPEFITEVRSQCRQFGWEVVAARSGPEARRLAKRSRPDLVVMGTDSSPESGWLICAKLAQECPGLQVVLVGGPVTPDRKRFAAFVGAAALLPTAVGAAGLARAMFDATLLAVG